MRSGLSENIEKAGAILSELDEKREKMLELTRELTRKCREAIFAMHRGDGEGSLKALSEARKLLRELATFKEHYPSLYYGGSVVSSQAEYVEAAVLHSILSSGSIPSLEELGVEPQAYLLGLGDTVGELRRSALEFLRRDKVEKAWEMLELMEIIFQELSKISLPEALVPGLRHKIDVARVLIENTRKDVLFSEKSGRLAKIIEDALKRWSERDGGSDA